MTYAQTLPSGLDCNWCDAMCIERKGERRYRGLSAGIGKRQHLHKFECADGRRAGSNYLHRRIGTKALARCERQADQESLFDYERTAVHSARARRRAPYEDVHRALDATAIQNELSHPAIEFSDDERVLSDQQVCPVHFHLRAIAGLGTHPQRGGGEVAWWDHNVGYAPNDRFTEGGGQAGTPLCAVVPISVAPLPLRRTGRFGCISICSAQKNEEEGSA